MEKSLLMNEWIDIKKLLPNYLRVKDKIAWCLEFLAQYGDVVLRKNA
jgi:hypothetical protein